MGPFVYVCMYVPWLYSRVCNMILQYASVVQLMLCETDTTMCDVCHGSY
jgi:hypothetical protein